MIRRLRHLLEYAILAGALALLRWLPHRLALVLAAIDAANSNDPHSIVVRGESQPKELAHAKLATVWVEALCDAPSDALRIAVRAHHLRRWERPRKDYPEGRAGYHRWRRDLQAFHAEKVGEILHAEECDDETIERVQAIVRKQGLGTDPEIQVFEDALCLVFLETQFRDLAERLPEAKLLDVTRKTLGKMSATARAHASELMDEADLALIERAGRSVRSSPR